MDKPYLINIEPSLGQAEALIFVDGYLSDRGDTLAENYQWWTILRQAGWQGSIYYLWWDVAQFSPSLELLSQLGSEALPYWQRHRSYVKRIGKSFLPKLIAQEIPVPVVSLMGCSLGSRIAYYAMREWFEAKPILKDVILLGGMIQRDRTKNWSYAASNLNGTLFNVYNGEDLLLMRFSQILGWERSPCGIKPIREVHPQILNIDAAPLMKTASYSPKNYLSVLSQILKSSHP
ncbi:DUF726 domain-containing protein [Spirulina subsalsa]|uniref:DUF726 domain-containing protein n=1 Tax=Spirulina subsalsa TaxID=54311 RepID=UPI0002EB145F|nr:DUF726 domain-containing protein [Spirulina subsalsa]